MILVDFEYYLKNLPYVTSKEIYVNGNTDKFHPEGLYSEIIFGPKHAYKCSCGAISGREYEGETCDLCGVTCVDGTQRSKRYAKIKLQKKVVRLFWLSTTAPKIWRSSANCYGRTIPSRWPTTANVRFSLPRVSRDRI